MLLLALSCLLFSATFGTSSADCTRLQEDANDFTDKVLKKWTEMFDSDETFDLDDFDHGLIELSNGKVWGLDQLVRTGEARVNCDGGRVVEITFPFNSTNPLRIRYQWRQELFALTLKGVAYARANKFHATATLRKDIDGTQASEVIFLDITKLGGVEVDVSGLAHVGWMISRFTSNMANIFQESFGNLVEKRMMQLFNSVLLRVKAMESH